MTSVLQRIRSNWNEYIHYPADGSIVDSNHPLTWFGASLLVLSVSGADARYILSTPSLDRFLFDVSWFLPALIFRSAYWLARCRTPRPIDLVDRHANALDTLMVLMCPAAIAVTGNINSFGGFSLLFFTGTLFYAWIGGSGIRHPWVALMAALAAFIPVALYRGPQSWMFLGFVLAPSVFTSLILGAHAEQSHRQMASTWRSKEIALRSNFSQALRNSDELSQAVANLAGVHHDISNALTGALLSSAMMSAKAVSLTDSTGSPALNREVERLHSQLNTLKGILQSARTLAMEMSPGSQASPVPASVQSSLDTACRWLTEANIALEVERALASDSTAVMVKGGQLGLTRILHNLLLNAAQGDGQRGATRVRVAARLEGSRTVISVADDGPGFLQEQLNAPLQIFQTTKAEGTGLGLLNVELAVKEVGGVLRRANGTKGGAVVSFDLESAPG